MPKTIQQVTVFLASPSDTDELRRSIRSVADEVNQIVSRWPTPVHLDIFGWERIPSGFDPRGAQNRIMSWCPPDQWDAVVGVFADKFGDGQPANTEFEINAGISLAEQESRPMVAVFFKKLGGRGHDSIRLDEYKDKIRKRGITTRTWETPEELQGLVRNTLFDIASHFARPGEEGKGNVQTAKLQLTLSCKPQETRAEGCAELAGDVELTFEGGRLRDHVTYLYDLTVFSLPSINLTTRVGDDRETTTSRLSGQWVDVAGRRMANNSLEFRNVRVRAMPDKDSVTLRLSGIRFNASQLGIPTGSSSTVSLAIVSSALDERTPNLPMKTVLVAHARVGCRFDVEPAGQDNLISSWSARVFAFGSDPNALFAEGKCSFIATFQEAYPDAFESPAAYDAGADSGTRLLARFTNVPDWVSIWVTPCDLPEANGAPITKIVIDGDGNGAGGSLVKFSGLWPPELVQVATMGCTGKVTWEIDRFSRYRSVAAREPKRLRYAVTVIYTQHRQPIPPLEWTMAVNGALAPLSTVATAGGRSAPVPRFIDTAVNRSVSFRDEDSLY